MFNRVSTMNDLRHYAGELEQITFRLKSKSKRTKMRIQQWVYAFSGEALSVFSAVDSICSVKHCPWGILFNLPPCSVILVWNTRQILGVSRFEMWLAETTDELPSGDPAKYGYPLISKSVANTFLVGGHEPALLVLHEKPEKRKAFQI